MVTPDLLLCVFLLCDIVWVLLRSLILLSSSGVYVCPCVLIIDTTEDDHAAERLTTTKKVPVGERDCLACEELEPFETLLREKIGTADDSVVMSEISVCVFISTCKHSWFREGIERAEEKRKKDSLVLTSIPAVLLVVSE